MIKLPNNTNPRDVTQYAVKHSNPATKLQLSKLKAVAYACAIVLANLKTAICCRNNRKLTGDEIRPYLRGWYDKGHLPECLKTYFVKTWIIPECDELLFKGGFKTHNTEMMFNNLTAREADYLIKQFTYIRQCLENPEKDIERVQIIQEQYKYRKEIQKNRRLEYANT